MLSHGIAGCQCIKKYIKEAVNRIMRVFKYLMGLLAAFTVYTLFSLSSGPKGFFAYNQLSAERERQLDNLMSLEITKVELEKIKNNLLYDQDTLLSHARQLGYGKEDDMYIRIVGLGGVKNPHNSAGRVYYAADPDYMSEKTIKIAALSVGLIVFAFFFVIELIESRYGRSNGRA